MTAPASPRPPEMFETESLDDFLKRMGCQPVELVNAPHRFYCPCGNPMEATGNGSCRDDTCSFTSYACLAGDRWEWLNDTVWPDSNGWSYIGGKA